MNKLDELEWALRQFALTRVIEGFPLAEELPSIKELRQGTAIGLILDAFKEVGYGTEIDKDTINDTDGSDMVRGRLGQRQGGDKDYTP